MTDLKKIVGNRLLAAISECRQKRNDYMVMVCDDYTLKVLSSILRIHQVNDAGVGAIVNLRLVREPLPNTPVIYFIRPEEESWSLLLKDFENKPMYGNVYLFTTSRVDNDLMAQIEKSKLLNRLKMFKELNIDFMALESRVFSLGREHTIPVLYFPSTALGKRSSELARTAEQITSLCVTLKEYPYVRYVSADPVTKELAQLVEKYLENVLRTLPNWNFNQNRGTLFLVDRAIDCVAPVMHEYTYQAMVNDLLDVKGEMCKIPPADESSEKDPDKYTHVLSDSDAHWVDLKHRHIAEAQPLITEKFNQFRSENAMANLGDNASLKEMTRAAKQMTSYKTEMQKFAKHMTILEKAFDVFSQLNLHQLGQLEQDMATGVNDDGKKTSKNDIMNRLIACIQSDQTGTVEKLRLIMIYIISQDGIKEATRKKLFTVARFDDKQQDAVQNLFNLGVTLQTSSKKTKGRKTNNNLKRAAKRAKDVPLQLMRFSPVLSELLEEMLLGKLDVRAYPYLKEPPESARPTGANSSNRSARNRIDKRGGRANKWRQNRGGFKETQDSAGPAVEEKSFGPRHIVFVIGGMTFSEIRSVYELAESHNADLLVGSSSTITANQYIEDLSSTNDLNDVELDLGSQ